MIPYQNYSQQVISNQEQAIQRQMNALQNQMNQLQQMQNQVQMQGIPPSYNQQANNNLPTYIVDDFANIPANMVPMDNLGAIFVKRDGSEIQCKKWMPEGKISTTPYQPILENFDSNVDDSVIETEKSKIGVSSEVIEAFINGVTDLSDRIASIEQKLTTQLKSSTRKNKEAESNE